MAIPRIKVWNNEILFPTDLNAEFDNTNQNAISSPATGSIDAGGYDITNLDNLALNSATFANSGTFPSVTGQLLSNGGVLALYDGTAVRINQCLAAVGSRGVIQSTADETQLYALDLFAGALGTSRKVQVEIMLRVGLLSGATVQIVSYFDGSLGASIGIGNSTGSTAALTLCPLVVTLLGTGATNAQIMLAECHITQIATTSADPFGAVSPIIMHGGGLAVNSTLAKSLQVNVLFSGSDAANQCDYLSVKTMLIG